MKDYKHFLRESFEYPELQNDSMDRLHLIRQIR